ncbi:hypothetical protein QUB08_18675 [Microcoleus sp. BR0-C5]|uniref:hypothetical protein n=1 Tax=Microcoleus sp. BR0-C5 TaxID=2818713 RepID=UPI002FD176AB
MTVIRSHLGALRKFDRTWAHYGNSIALGRITKIRSHLGALRKFDRTWGHYGNSIALGGITAIRSPNLDSIALTGITTRWADRDCRFRWLKALARRTHQQSRSDKGWEIHQIRSLFLGDRIHSGSDR